MYATTAQIEALQRIHARHARERHLHAADHGSAWRGAGAALLRDLAKTLGAKSMAAAA